MTALLLLTGPQAGRRHEVMGEVLIGRSPSCTIALEDAKVSRRHARLVVERGQARVSDLGSRNGTLVNGEKLQGEVVLVPGDRLQIGDSTVLYEPATRASLSERSDGRPATFAPLEELVPAVGLAGGLYHVGLALLSATSEAMVLRRAAEELARAANAEKAAALLGGTEGLLTAAVVGADAVEAPRSMVAQAVERKEAGRLEGVMCAPLLASGGAPLGILYAERPEPFGHEEQQIIAALGRLAGEACAQVRSRSEVGSAPLTLVGASRPFKKLIEAGRRAAASTERVVIFGSGGTGRALLAQYIHANSSRGLGPWVVVDCRRPLQKIEESLFGGSTSPGTMPVTSALLRADGGSLLLRHLESLPTELGERLARLLVRNVAPVRQGGEETVDVRVMATAARSVSEMMARGELDVALGEALAGMEIEALALKDRLPDVVPLFDHFAAEAARALRREGPKLTPDALRLVVDYPWPGNIEELRGVAHRLALLYAGQDVTALQLPSELQAGTEVGPQTLAQRVSRLERDAISEALREAGGKKIRAAELLGISRPTLDKKMIEYQLVAEKKRS